MGSYTTLAICTLVVNWALTLLAFISIVLQHTFRPSPGIHLDDVLICIAFTLGIAIVSLSTWAIVDESQGQHQQDVSESQLARAAKVGDCLLS